MNGKIDMAALALMREQKTLTGHARTIAELKAELIRASEALIESGNAQNQLRNKAEDLEKCLEAEKSNREALENALIAYAQDIEAIRCGKPTWKERSDAMEKACAEMRADFSFLLYEIAACSPLSDDSKAACMNELQRRLPGFTILSADCGKGYVKAEDVKPLKEALEFYSKCNSGCIVSGHVFDHSPAIKAIARAKDLGI